MKLIFFFLLIITGAYGINNIAYVETNNDALSNIACYLLSTTVDNTVQSTPFFGTAVLFAANIRSNSRGPQNCSMVGVKGEPCIYFNKAVGNLLTKTDQISTLKKNGIRVVVALLPDHQNAGWSCINPTETAKIKNFSNLIVEFVNKYKLDGIVIDDEYSVCPELFNDTIFHIVASLKKEPAFIDKSIDMVVLGKSVNKFTYTDDGKKLSDYLGLATPGWYPLDINATVVPYLSLGMNKLQLYPSVSTVLNTDPNKLANFVKSVISNNYPGIMVFGVTDKDQAFLDTIAKAQYGNNTRIIVKENCIIPSPWYKKNNLKGLE